MEDERQLGARVAIASSVGRAWIIPHALLLVISVALPFVVPDVWSWTTATGAGGLFGAMLMLDLEAVSRSRNQQPARALLPGEPAPRPRRSPAVVLAMALLLVSGLSLAYEMGITLELWRPI